MSDAISHFLREAGPFVFAPNGNINTGLVHGGQQVANAAGNSGAAEPMRQGPVRADQLAAARRCFVPPPGFTSALTALDAGIAVLVGDRGTGRETHALNLLAHGNEEPVIVQVDGAVDISRWGPRHHGVHGYLVMEPSDPFELRAWDLSRLEARLAEAGARLVIVSADRPGLTASLEDHLGRPVIRHMPPAPRQIFAARLAEAGFHDEVGGSSSAAPESSRFHVLLPEGLPPRRAVQAAEAVLRMGVEDASEAAVMQHLVQAEGLETLARAQEEPVLLAHLLSISVYGGLHRNVVAEQAEGLSRRLGPPDERVVTERSPRCRPGDDLRQRPSPEVLRVLGAHRVQGVEGGAADTVSFFWPAVSETVWEVLCRNHADILPLLHAWLAASGEEGEQARRAGLAAAAMAVATGGRSLEHLRDLASAPSPSAPQVAAWCLGAAVQNPPSERSAVDLLDQWSVSADASLRMAVAHACDPDYGGVTADQAMRLLQQLMETWIDDADDLSMVTAITEALRRRFEAGVSEVRLVVLRRMCDWASSDGVLSLLVALVFPMMAGTDLGWWIEQILSGKELVSRAVQLTGHALNESVTYALMCEVLITWCSEADGAEQQSQALGRLMDGMVAARQPGFLRWLLAVGRSPDTMPGKEPAARALSAWRGEDLS
ncbi:hypothetical protein OG338_24635 [Streptomyces sp. NBC_00726]|uniref:hypothetical protein n=1 Tax=Streptomyces sp. NBC_00726 TaxID=2903674 RepID=UPI0038668281